MVLPGFNTDFKYRGETYHAQTEDSGPANPVVVTLLYYKGAILASKKTSYRELLERDGWQRELMEIMKSQHKEIMRELLAGAFDRGEAAPRTAPAGAAPPPVAEPAPTPAPPAATAAAPDPKRAPGAPPLAARSAAQAASMAPAAPKPAQAPARPATLDEQIFAYLEAHAAGGAGGGH